MRIVRYVAFAGLFGVVALAAAGCVASYVTFFSRADVVDEALATLPPDLNPPPAVLYEAALRVHPHGVAHIAARRLLEEQYPPHPRATLSAYRFAMWSYLLPLTRSPEEIMSLYAGSMRFEGRQGLEAGSRHYFSKPPSELSYDEALSLVVIDLNPIGNSPVENPARYRRAMQRYSR